MEHLHFALIKISKEILEESRIPYTYILINFSRASIERSDDETHDLLKE